MATWVKPPRGMFHITPHFSFAEAVCRHCGKIPSLAEVVETAQWLERVRHEVYEDRPMHITSWCRCPVHNANVGGAPQSYHMKGWAVDFVVRGLSIHGAWRLVSRHQGEGKLIGGLGDYETWLHIDRGPPRIWSGP